MKNIIWAAVILIAIAGIMLELRYAITVYSPIVAKMDRFTGDVWVASSGVWRKVEHPVPANKTETAKGSSSEMTGRAKR
jgi:hypothetical protein